VGLQDLLPFNRKEKSLDELEEEDQAEGLKLSIAQKKELERQLKARGVKASAFASLSSALKWLRTH